MLLANEPARRINAIEERAPMGSHMRSIEPWLPPWLLNQSAKEMLSSARMSRMPPSGSMSARTIGDVPNARLLATLSLTDSCGVVKNALRPAWQTGLRMSRGRARASGHANSTVWQDEATGRCHQSLD